MDQHDQEQRLYSVEAEQAVLGALLLAGEDALPAIDAAVSPGDFYLGNHRLIFEAARRLADNNQPLDPLTVGEFLREHNKLEPVGGLPYLNDLAMNAPSTANAASHAGIIRERAKARRWVQTLKRCSEAIRTGINPESNELLADPFAWVDARLLALTDNTTRAGFESMRDAIKRTIDDINEKAKSGELPGLRTGFRHVDYRLSGGFQPGDLVVVGARPGMGKTNYLLNIMRNTALQKRDGDVLVFSLEMSNLQLVQRTLSAQGKVKYGLLKSAKVFNEGDSAQRFTKAASVLADVPVYLCEDPALTVGEIRAMAMQHHRRGGVRLVLVDYLGLIESAGEVENQTLRLAEISRTLKKLAKQMGCPVVVAAQVNRECEKRKDKRPLLSDLRDSGAIEQDADVVQFLYRDEYYNENTPHPHQVEVITAKLRDGEPGSDYLRFNGEYALLEDFEHGPQPGEQSYDYQR